MRWAGDLISWPHGARKLQTVQSITLVREHRAQPRSPEVTQITKISGSRHYCPHVLLQDLTSGKRAGIICREGIKWN